MRIYLKLSISNKVIPFNYQPILTGVIHKWIGKENNVHGKMGQFSFSWLQNVDAYENGIKTKNGTYFFISSFDEELIKTIIAGIRNDAEIYSGIRVIEIQIVDNPQFQSPSTFQFASPIFIKMKKGDQIDHVDYSQAEATVCLTENLRQKLTANGITPEGVSVSFDKTYLNPKTKIVSYKNIKNKVNFCPVVIEGTSEQIAFAWSMGVGNSTGIGFGALK